jgi:serine/threonine-protein kinase
MMNSDDPFCSFPGARLVASNGRVMNDFKRSESAERSSETTIQPAANTAGRARFCRPKREMITGSGPHLTQETHALLRLRLRAAALILLIGFGVFLIRHAGGVLAGEPSDPLMLGLHILIVLVLGIIAWVLYRQRPMSVHKLHLAELVLFGLPAIYFLMMQSRSLLYEVSRGIMPPTMPLWLLLIFTYGMFIPNTLERAACVIGAMALAPNLLAVSLMLAYPQAAEAMTPTDLTHQALFTLIAAIAAVSGTHLINTLRREVFEARQLGQYRLLSRLDTGGMGEVYLAEHRMLKRPCAVKLIRPEQAGHPHALARFEREVQMTARLSHWNTVEIYDYGRTEDGTFFYVMEYLPGLSLEDLLERHGALSPERVVYLMRQVCQGLREAHHIGLIHRDIKPSNIFVAQRGGLYDVIKLLDFGLVKPLTEVPSARLTQEGAISGTPLFMSPEQARGLGGVDARSDIYSLGAVGYVMLTGRPPFERPTPFDVMMAHARDEVVPPSEYRPGVPADLERVILRCLAKRPEDRFQDTSLLEQALAKCTATDRWSQSEAARWWQENGETEQPGANLRDVSVG